MKIHTRHQILKKIKNNRAKFLIEIPFREFVRNQDGVEMLNSYVDDCVEDGYLLMDMSYKAKSIKQENVVIEVDADCSDYKIGT